MKNNTNKSLRNILITFGILSSISFQSNAEDLFGGDTFFDTPTSTSDSNSCYKSGGSLVIVNCAKDSGIIVRGTDDGMEQEYYVVPKDDGSKTFIYDEGLTVCDNNGCY